MNRNPSPTPDPGLSAGPDALRSLIAGTADAPVRLPLLSGSMSPALLPGDILTVRPARGRDVRVGDVTVFLRDGRATAHRILFALRLGARALLLEMGDANRFPSTLSQNAVLGVVDCVERDGNRVLDLRGDTGKTERRAARRTARRMLWRFLVRVLPYEIVKGAAGK